MKQRLTAFARDVDTFCGRLNDGLTAVAILLGFAVMTMSVVRVQEIIPQAMELVPSGYQMPMGN